MTNRKPTDAIDYPALNDDLFVIWHGNDKLWPDAGRETSYLTDKKTDTMRGFALFTINWQGAETFTSKSVAEAWLAENEAKRPYPYGVNITTVAELKRARGYVE